MSDKLQVALNEFMFRANSTAKRLRQTAQGCRAQRLPWERTRKMSQPQRGCVAFLGEQIVLAATSTESDVSKVCATLRLSIDLFFDNRYGSACSAAHCRLTIFQNRLNEIFD